MTNTKSFLAKTTAIACLGLRERLGLEPSHVLGVRGGLLVHSYRVSRFFCGGRSHFLLRASQQNPSPQPRLNLAFASKAERLFGLMQATVSGVILLRSSIFAVQGDRISARCFLWKAIAFLSKSL